MGWKKTVLGWEEYNYWSITIINYNLVLKTRKSISFFPSPSADNRPYAYWIVKTPKSRSQIIQFFPFRFLIVIQVVFTFNNKRLVNDKIRKRVTLDVPRNNYFAEASVWCTYVVYVPRGSINIMQYLV